MRIDIVRQAVTELAAATADGVLPAPILKVLEAQRIHQLRIPDFLHGLPADVPDDQLAAPIKKAGAHQAVGIHRIAVENIWAGVGIAHILLIDATADRDAGVLFNIELRPARSEILDEDAITMVAEGVEKRLAFRLVDELGRDLDRDLAAAPISVKPFDVFNKACRNRI